MKENIIPTESNDSQEGILNPERSFNILYISSSLFLPCSKQFKSSLEALSVLSLGNLSLASGRAIGVSGRDVQDSGGVARP